MISKVRLSFPWVFIHQLTRFLIVGLSGLFVDIGGLYVLHTLSGWSLAPSAIISTELAIINNFFWNDMWTFSDISLQKSSGNQKLQRFLKFNLICLFGLIFNNLIMNYLFYKFEVNEYIGKFIAIILVTFWNFGMNLKVNWQVREAQLYQ